MLPSANVKTLGVRNTLIEAVPALQGARSPLRPTGFSVYASPVLFADLLGLRHRRKTRYGWVANPYPTGTFTLQDMPSFARRDNDSDEPRLTATDRSGSEGSKLSSVGWSALIGFTFTHKQVP